MILLDFYAFPGRNTARYARQQKRIDAVPQIARSVPLTESARAPNAAVEHTVPSVVSAIRQVWYVLITLSSTR